MSFGRLSKSLFLRRSQTWRRPSHSTTGIAIGLFGASFYILHTKSISADAPASAIDDHDEVIFKQNFYRTKDVRPSQPQTRDGGVLERLREFEESHVFESNTGISRFDVMQIASNNPIEDAHSEMILPVPTGLWSFFTVLDGHNGWQTSAWLRDNLIPAVVGAIADVYTKYQPVDENPFSHVENQPNPPSHEIDAAIKDTFKRLDDDICIDTIDKVFSSPSKAEAIQLLAPAHSGSCCLLSFYDSHSCTLRTAVTGDSRAVLGRRIKDADGHDFYEVHVLSVDQNGSNPEEEARLSALHPGETIVEKGRVLGWGLSRAFGDAAYKWGLDIQKRLHEEYLGDIIRANVKTPPYFTAEPEITTTKVQPGDFLIMATDGLWDCLTNEEAVGLVGLWLNDKAKENRPALLEAEEVNTFKRDDLPVTVLEDHTVMYPWWRTKKRFVNVDANAATHLARNAFGGADSDLTAALLSMTLPRSRRYRDDLTAIVVFF